MNVFYAGEVPSTTGRGPVAARLAPGARACRSYAGKDAYDYQFTAMGGELTLGTFCHENGHMLCDYPDLYDYGYESSGVGAFCLMCGGGSADEKNPAHVSAYLKRLSGWARNVTAIQHDQQLALPAGQNDFALFARTASEYFLLEHRRRSGRDASLPGEGLTIWHVDEDGSNNNEQRTPTQHYELSLEQADGLFQLEQLRGHDGDAGDLFGPVTTRFADTTTPDSKWWDGTASNLEVDQISVAGTTAVFRTRLFPGGGGTQAINGASTPGVAIPDNASGGITDTIAIVQDGSIGTVAVTLDIAHTYVGDLRVTLLTPWGDAIRLHDRQGSDADDIKRTLDETALQTLATLRGRGTRGNWRLQVEDLAPADTGRLERWALAFTTSGGGPAEVVLEEAPGTHVPDASPAGVARSLATAATGTVGSVEVTVDISHPWIGDLRLTLRSPSGDAGGVARPGRRLDGQPARDLYGSDDPGAWRAGGQADRGQLATRRCRPRGERRRQAESLEGRDPAGGLTVDLLCSGISLCQLHYLVAVADAGPCSAAAQRLGRVSKNWTSRTRASVSRSQ